MDSPFPAVLASLVGFVLGWIVSSQQHLLYREPEYRAAPMSGRRALLARGALGSAMAAAFAIAFRPDHYEPFAAALTAASAAVLLTIASTDFERRIVPNKLTGPAAVAAVVMSVGWPDRDVVDIALGAGFMVGVGLGLVLIGEAARTILNVGGTAFGIGDAKLMVLIGLLVGWPEAVGALFIGIIGGGVAAVIVLFISGWKSIYSYGPYLAFGGIVLLLWPSYY